VAGLGDEVAVGGVGGVDRRQVGMAVAGVVSVSGVMAVAVVSVARVVVPVV
jgi:hypothetical protein